MTDWHSVWRRLAMGESLDGLGLKKRDGRWDLRGIGQPPIPWARGSKLPTFRRVMLRGCDFSGTWMWNLRLFHTTIDDCVFDGAHLVDWRALGTSVTRCSFREADLQGGFGGDGKNPNQWRSVDFTSAIFRDTAHYMESYEDCDFGDAKLRRVDFEGSRHIRSRFAGLIDDCEFRALPKGVRRAKVKNTMEGVDLGRATVRFTDFHMLDLSACVLPESPEHLKFADAGVFAQRVLREISRSDKPHLILRVLMERTRDNAPPGGGGPGFRHRLDLGDTPEEIEHAEALMRACGAY